MKSILFLIKLTAILWIFTLTILLIEGFFNGYPVPEFFWIIFLIAFFTFYFHEWGKKYKWEDDYWALLFKTGYKKYSSKLKKSKARMKDELNED